MTETFKPREELQYFNARTVQDALSLADARYRSSYSKGEEDQLDAYLGTRNAAGEIIQVGLRAKIWGLVLVLVYHSEKRTGQQKQMKLSGSLFPLSKHRKDLQQLLTTFNHRSIPSAAICSDLQKTITASFATLFQKEGIVAAADTLIERMEGALALPSRCPSDVYQHLVKELKPGAPFVRDDLSPAKRGSLQELKDTDDRCLHWCEEIIRKHMAPPYGERTVPALRREEAVDTAHRIADRFRATVPSSSILLAARPHTGKKAIVVEFLRHIQDECEDEERLCFELNSPEISLPVLAVSAHSRDYFNLTCFVLAFLRRYQDRTEKPDIKRGGRNKLSDYVDDIKRHADPDTAEGGMGRLLKEIVAIHKKYPCMFVFTDVDSIDEDSVRKVVRGYGFSRLINALTLSNENSRFLLTSTGEASEEKKNSKWRLGLTPAPEVIMVPPLEFDEVTRYLDDGTYPEPLRAYIKTWRESTVQAEKKEQFDGETLLATCALLQLTAPDGVDDTVRAVETFLRHNRCLSRPRTDATTIFLQLFKLLEKRDLLRAVILIATSDDGLRDDTLKEALKDWSKHRHDGRPALSGTELDKRLREVAETAGSFFLRRLPMVHYDEDEYDFLERASEKDQVWDFDAHISEHILRTAQTKRARKLWPTLCQDANRALARAARRRAQIKKVRSSLPVTLDPGRDASRDIQAFTALLASIQPRDIREHTLVDGQALRLLSDQVFTLSSKFDATVALRYAVYCLLRSDIDRDSRLTMVSDQDGLRLRLYLLLFFDLGERHFWQVYQLNEAEIESRKGIASPNPRLRLPDKIPDHIKKGFKRQEILEILDTVALTAFHSQQAGIIEWAKELSQKIIDEACEALDDPATKDQVRGDLNARSIRIDCSRIDMWIQLGGPIDGRGRKHLDTLNEVKGLLRVNFPAFESAADGIDHDKSAFSTGSIKALEDVLRAESLPRLAAWMRLKAREAQLVFLTDSRERALTIYRNLARIEHVAARYEGNDDPIVLSGRTARRYIRVLLQPDSLRMQKRDRNEINEARRVIEVNISRLRRFSGAERVGVLMDMARRHLAEGDIGRALLVAQNAYDRAFAGSISHGGKIDVLTLLCDLRLKSVMHISEKNKVSGELDLSEELEKVVHHTKLMLNLSEALDYRPARAVSRYLAALCAVEQMRLARHATRREITTASTMVTQAIKEMAIYGDITYAKQMGELKRRLSDALDSVATGEAIDPSALL